MRQDNKEGSKGSQKAFSRSQGPKGSNQSPSKPIKVDQTVLITGPLSVSGKGTGYISDERFTEDIEIDTTNLHTALHNDEVEVKLLPFNRMGRNQGEVVRIVQRAKMEFVGVLEEERGMYFLVPDDRKMYTDIAISKENFEKNPEAKLGMKMLVKIVSWNDGEKNPQGEIIKVIGLKGKNNTEMESILIEKGFRIEYPAEVNKEAEYFEHHQDIPADEIAKRRDVRGTVTLTIDPIDAKDFDDAISFKDLGNDRFEIGVHIADVSYYVRPKTAIDTEAKKRGVSVYLVDRTIPMLPEILSNNLCSLRPNEDKLAVSAIFIMDSKGKVHERWFGKTIIHSSKRFTYEGAQEVLEGRGTEFASELKILNSIAKILERAKYYNGAISFETDEVKFELDAEGRPIRVYRKERKDAHKLVEEFMLLANREVAEAIEKLGEKTKKAKGFVYRIHDVPNPEKIEELSIFVKALGYNLPYKKGENVRARDINALLRQIEGKAEEGLIKTATLRSMAKAIYSTKNIGHFGLGFGFYTHFTSPIRRYPDLMVHRLLMRHLAGEIISDAEMAEYEKISRDSTENEIRATMAERDSIKYKQVEYMQGHLGEEFDGTITGVTEWGIYVEDKETKCEGMVKLRDLQDDFYKLDQKNYCLIGDRTKNKYSLGDTVKFKVVNADIERKTLDYQLV
jgi:ribonuclease R